jgi:hypothetical protein
MTEKVQGHSGKAKQQPATAGSGGTTCESGPAKQAEESINPSSPGNTGTTPGTNAKVG